MNVFVNSPDLAMSIAHRAIADRVEQARTRTLVRAARRSHSHPEQRVSPWPRLGSQSIGFPDPAH
jgi:hypothetical protein